MTVYATVGNVTTSPWFVDIDPEAAPLLLAVASRLVRAATRTAQYDVDDNGAPTDTVVAAAFRDAVCSQVATWVALSIDPVKGAADAGTTIGAKSFGGATIQYSVYASTVEARARAATSLSADAARILVDAGLIGTPSSVTG